MIFVDTGAFLARYLPKDQFHAEAQKAWTKISKKVPVICTSNFVLDETITLLTRRASPKFAVEKALLIYESSSVKILRPDQEDEQDALEWLSKLSDQKLSFTDAVSFALMKRHKLKRAFTYDRHFEQAGFQRWNPGR